MKHANQPANICFTMACVTHSVPKDFILKAQLVFHVKNHVPLALRGMIVLAVYLMLFWLMKDALISLGSHT